MELVQPSVEILSITPDALKVIELAGRVCYKSEDKITEESSASFVAKIKKLGHMSVLEHAVFTARFICDRGVTHEIVRHRLASYSQESTRYCNYGKLGVKFIIPCDFVLTEDDLIFLRDCERQYNYCIEQGRTPQQARYFLPNGLKTEIVMTANLREWLHFFTLRTSIKAHPQMREVADMLLAQIQRLLPEIFYLD